MKHFKKILFALLFLPSLSFADRLGTLTPKSEVCLSTQVTSNLSSGNTNYVQISTGQTVQLGGYNVSNATVTGPTNLFGPLTIQSGQIRVSSVSYGLDINAIATNTAAGYFRVFSTSTITPTLSVQNGTVTVRENFQFTDADSVQRLSLYHTPLPRSGGIGPQIVETIIDGEVFSNGGGTGSIQIRASTAPSANVTRLDNDAMIYLSPSRYGGVISFGNALGDTNLWVNKEYQQYDDDSSNYVASRSSAVVAANMTIVYPSAPGTAGQVRTILDVVGSTVTETWSTLSSALTPGDTNYIQNRNTLQAGATAYPAFVQVGSSLTVTGGVAIDGQGIDLRNAAATPYLRGSAAQGLALGYGASDIMTFGGAGVTVTSPINTSNVGSDNPANNIRQFSTFTSDVLKVGVISGQDYFRVENGTTTERVLIDEGGANTVGLVIRQGVSTASDSFRVVNAAGTKLTYIDSSGNHFAPNGNATTPGYGFMAGDGGLYRYGTNSVAMVGGGGNNGIVTRSGVIQLGTQWGGGTYTFKPIDAGAGNTNRSSTPLLIKAGEGTGNGSGSYVSISASTVTATSTSLQTLVEVARFNGDGRVGIGTTTPQGTLDVVSSSSQTPTAIFQSILKQTTTLTEWRDATNIQKATMSVTGAFSASSVTVSTTGNLVIPATTSLTNSATGSLWLDTTADQIIFQGNTSTTPAVMMAKRTACYAISDLTSTDDNVTMFTAPSFSSVTILNVYGRYDGSGTTVGQISLHHANGTAMTLSGTVIFSTGSAKAAPISVLSNPDFTDGEGLQFDTTNTPNPTTDDYMICVDYIFKQQ